MQSGDNVEEYTVQWDALKDQVSEAVNYVR